jgi:hypothetical protein
MGFLKTNYEDVNDFAALPIGDYECIVSEVKMVETSTKKQMVKVTLTVRDDIEQGGKKRKFFDNLVVQDNMMWKFQQVSKACDFPADTDFASPEEFASAIQYKNVIIRNKHEVYNDETQDRVANWKQSKFGAGEGGFAGGDAFSGNGGAIEISDEDLPF